MLLVHFSCNNDNIILISQEITITFYSLVEKTSNATLCLVIKVVEK